MQPPLLAEDLRHSLERSQHALLDLRGANLFVTGGTGFFGRWIVETFQCANRELSLGATLTILSRNPGAFLRDMPHLASDDSLRFCTGNVATFDFPEGEFSHVIHAATETNADSSPPTALALFDGAVSGTRRLLEFARTHGTRRLLLTSSGAVYGPQPPEVTHLTEEHAFAPPTGELNTGYGQGKRAAEYLCTAYHHAYGIESVVARCFAFVGAHLPLDLGFAVGNFIRDALNGNAIVVAGDGTPYRSYLYAADLAAWLWVLLTRGAGCRAYNVGSEQSINIADLARLVAAAAPTHIDVQIKGVPVPGQAPKRYVPGTARAAAELGLAAWIPLEEAIRRSMVWYRRRIQSNDNSSHA